MATLIIAISIVFQIDQAITNLYYENKKALRYCDLKNSTVITLTKRNLDLKIEMNHILKNITITFFFCEFDGHADDEDDFDYSATS